MLRKAKSGLDVEAVALALMSQAFTVRSLHMRHDAVPPRYLTKLGLMSSLTQVVVRR